MRALDRSVGVERVERREEATRIASEAAAHRDPSAIDAFRRSGGARAGERVPARLAMLSLERGDDAALPANPNAHARRARGGPVARRRTLHPHEPTASGRK